MSSLAELVGPDRVLFGSDFPFAPDVLAGIQVAGLVAHPGYDEAERQLVERDNALRIFPRLAGRLAAHA